MELVTTKLGEEGDFNHEGTRRPRRETRKTKVAHAKTRGKIRARLGRKARRKTARPLRAGGAACVSGCLGRSLACSLRLSCKPERIHRCA
jgi:hypothetical protein